MLRIWHCLIKRRQFKEKRKAKDFTLLAANANVVQREKYHSKLFKVT